MKKVFLICIFISTIYASDVKLASSIFSMVAVALTQKTNPGVYVHLEIESIENYPAQLIIIDSCLQADIVILSNTKNIPKQCEGKILFGTRYSHLKDTRVVGAFFWQKGRPNILFYRDRLEKNNIKLDSSFNKYIEK